MTAKVKIDVKAGVNPVVVTTEDGRNITLRKPSALAKLDFAKAAGSDKVNFYYLGLVDHLQYVANIDGMPVACPTTEQELRALYQRLDDANELVMKAVAENFGSKETQKEDEELKNS